MAWLELRSATTTRIQASYKPHLLCYGPVPTRSQAYRKPRTNSMDAQRYDLSKRLVVSSYCSRLIPMN